MQNLIKLVVIGPGRKIMYRYIQQIPDGGDLADFSSIIPGIPGYVVIKAEDHHSKAHIHLLSEAEAAPLDLVSGLLKTHPDLRFTMYYENPEGYGTIHGRNGKIETQSFRAKE